MNRLSLQDRARILGCLVEGNSMRAREKNVPGDLRGQFGYGDVYTWTAICADTKLTKPFAQRLLWRQGLRITFGIWRR